MEILSRWAPAPGAGIDVELNLRSVLAAEKWRTG
jgi:hypothetical protein